MQVEMLMNQIWLANKDGKLDREIAVSLGLPASTVSHYREEMGLKSNRKYHSHEEYRELYDKGLGDREISSSLGVAQSTVRAWRSQFNLPPNQGLKEGNAIREMLREPDEVYEK